MNRWFLIYFSMLAHWFNLFPCFQACRKFKKISGFIWKDLILFFFFLLNKLHFVQQSKSWESRIASARLLIFFHIHLFSCCPGYHWKVNLCNTYFGITVLIFSVFRVLNEIYLVHMLVWLLHFIYRDLSLFVPFFIFIFIFFAAFEITIDHPHTHVVKCTQLVRGEH